MAVCQFADEQKFQSVRGWSGILAFAEPSVVCNLVDVMTGSCMKAERMFDTVIRSVGVDAPGRFLYELVEFFRMLDPMTGYTVCANELSFSAKFIPKQSFQIICD